MSRTQRVTLFTHEANIPRYIEVSFTDLGQTTQPISGVTTICLSTFAQSWSCYWLWPMDLTPPPLQRMCKGAVYWLGLEPAVVYVDPEHRDLPIDFCPALNWTLCACTAHLTPPKRQKRILNKNPIFVYFFRDCMFTFAEEKRLWWLTYSKCQH